MATIDVSPIQGFDENYYLTAKAAQLTATTGQSWNVAQTLAAIQAAGLTAEQHYSIYGCNEGLAPNAYYNDSYYATSKAAQAGITVDQLRLAWYNASGSTNLYTHYMAYGAYETGVNPSSGFNDASYYAAKAAQMGGTTTPDQAKAAIQAAGMNAISHYLLYGINESLTYTPTASSVVGQTYTLTTGVDVLTGTGGNDLFVGTNTTLTTGDNLTDNGGTDTLQSTFGAGAAPLVSLNGIENVEFTSSATELGAGVAINTGNWTGVQKISVAGLGQTITDSELTGAGNSFVGLKNNVTLSAKNLTVAVDNDAVMAVQFGADKLGSTTATLDLAVEDVVGATASTGVANILVDTQGTDKITKLNVAATGTNRVQLEGAGAAEISLTDITANGSGNLNLSVDAVNAVITNLANVTASGMTGKFTANVSASTKNVTFVGSAGANTVTFGNGDNTITGGAAGDSFTIGTGKNTINALGGNDTVTTALADLTTADAIDLGDGTRDAIMYNNVTTLNLAGITANGKTALDAQKNVEVVGSSAAVTAIDFGYLSQKVNRLSGNLTAAVTGTNVDGNTLEFTGNGITGVAGDALTVSGVLPNRTLNLEFNGAAGVTLQGTDAAGNTGLTVSSGISTVNILSTTSATSTTGITNSIQNAAATTATHSIDNVSAGTFVLTGNTDFTVGMGLTAGFTNQVDFNASAFTGKLSIAASTGADVITGGTGNDTITALGGNDTIVLTAGGVDKVVFSTAETNGKDTITGFTASSATGADSLNIVALGDGAIGGGITATITSAAAQQAWTTDSAYIIDTTGAAGNLTTGGAAAVTDFTNLTQVSAYLAERFTIGAEQTGAIVLNNTASGSTSSYVYSVTDDGTGAFNAADLTLVGVLDRGANTLIASNVLFA